MELAFQSIYSSLVFSEEDIDFLNALLNVSDQDGSLDAVYTSQKL